MPEQPESLSFPDAVMLNDGGVTSPQGNLVQTNYVDLSGKLPMGGVILAKVSEPQYDLRTLGTVRLSRPGVFRTTGEVLVKDDQEGEARTETRDTVEEREDGDLDRRVRALQAGVRLGRSGLSVKDATAKSTRTKTASAKVTFGRDWLIYSTSIWPSPDEEEAWRQTFPDAYMSVVRVYRPVQFAFALGLGICEHVGVSGKPAPMTGTYHGFRTVKVERSSQMVLHGPVLYVDDAYRTIEMAEDGWPQICSMIFVKSGKYAAQKEYRFAVLSIPEEMGDVVDLPVSGMMQDCLKPVKTPLVGPEPEIAVGKDETETAGKRETSRNYTYRRRTVKRESGNWGAGEDKEGRSKEEIVEETVTSPDEVPEPFPSEEKQPDVIIFHQVGSEYRFQHRAYRDEETARWRIETLRENLDVVEKPRLGKPPSGLDVPEDLRLKAVDTPPVTPEFILDLCLNPSVPRPPVAYPLLKRLSGPEIGHVMGTYWALTMSLSLVDRPEQEKAAASGWSAFRFVLDLVTLFGPIVKSVCVIDECVVVVEIETAPSTGAVGWATFSGTGTYTLYVDRGGVEELVYPGEFSRAGALGESTLVETLTEHGWCVKDLKGQNKDYRHLNPKAWASEARRAATKWRQRKELARNASVGGLPTIRNGRDYRRWISVMARDMRRRRRGLGIGREDAAARTGLSVAEYARIERGRVPKEGDGFSRMMTVGRGLGVGGLRLEYLRPYRTHLGVELSESRLVMFLERLSSDVSGSRAQGYYVSPYNVLKVVEDVGLCAVLEGERARDRALFALWVTTILMQCRGSDHDQYVRLARESVEKTEVLTADIASGMVGTEAIHVARHDASVGDICDKLKEMLALGYAEEGAVVVYATERGQVEVADLC